MTTAELAGVVTLAGTAVAVGALVYLHVARTGLSPVRNAVSQYGITTYRAWYRAQTMAMGVAGAALAVGLHVDLSHASGAGVVVALVALFAACRLVISWFPMDAPGLVRTSRGGLHGLLAILTFVSVVVAAIRLCKVLDPGAAFDALGSASRALGWLMAACVVVMFLARLAVDLRRSFGLIERVLYALVVVWLAVVGGALATGHLATFTLTSTIGHR